MSWVMLGGTRDDGLQAFRMALVLLLVVGNARVSLAQPGLSQEGLGAQIYDELGVNLYYSGMYEESKKYFDKAIAVDPKEASHYSSRGMTLSKMGRFQEALKDHEIAMKLRPWESGMWVARASTEEDMKEYDKAIADLTQAVKLKTCNLGPILSQRAKVFYLSRRYVDAKRDFEDAPHYLASVNNDIDYHFFFGLTKARLGDIVGAIAELKSAERLCSNSIPYVHGRGIDLLEEQLRQIRMQLERLHAS